MSLPKSRERTYIAGVTRIPADDMNAIQDAHVEKYHEVLRDHFTGSTVNESTWDFLSLTGSPTAQSDSSNGGFGALSLDGSTGGGSGQRVASLLLAMGTHDFRFRARMRTAAASVDASTIIYVGVSNTGLSQNLLFAIDGASSTTLWRVVVDAGSSSAPNGTAASVSTTYQEFEIRKDGTTVTLTVDGVVHHTETGYSTGLDDARVLLFADNSGEVLIDVVDLVVLY